MPKHKENILRLRALGYSYNRIQKELGLSKGTISYHCGSGVKERTYKRTSKYAKQNPLYNRLDHFMSRETKNKESKIKIAKIEHAVWRKLYHYISREYNKMSESTLR